MPSEAIYQSECPICGGKGQIEILTVLSKNAIRKNATEGHIKTCEFCGGRGKVFICQKRKK
jgi:RecJ-like exonuclease